MQNDVFMRVINCLHKLVFNVDLSILAEILY